MKLIAQIKLVPSAQQSRALRDTLETVNAACNRISEIAWDRKRFSQFSLHHESYYAIKESFALCAQVTVRAISKVSDAYKVNKKHKRRFRINGAITYDSRILWGFYQLKQFLAYKARMFGVALFEVDPKHTSQQCSQCGHTEKRNRKSQSLFSCVSCGFSTLADFNAAINIAARASVREPIVAAA